MLETYIILKLVLLGYFLVGIATAGMIILLGAVSWIFLITDTSYGDAEHKIKERGEYIAVLKPKLLIKICICCILIGGLIPTKEELAMMIGVDIVIENKEEITSMLNQVNRIGKKGLDVIEENLEKE